MTRLPALPSPTKATSLLLVSNSFHHLTHFLGQRGDNADVVIWDYNSKSALFRLCEHDYEVTNLAFSHDDQLLISTGNSLDGKLFIWNTQNGHIVSSLKVAS